MGAGHTLSSPCAKNEVWFNETPIKATPTGQKLPDSTGPQKASATQCGNKPREQCCSLRWWRVFPFRVPGKNSVTCTVRQCVFAHYSSNCQEKRILFSLRPEVKKEFTHSWQFTRLRKLLNFFFPFGSFCLKYLSVVQAAFKPFIKG